MEIRKCIVCLIDKPINKFSSCWTKGKIYGRKRTCIQCNYNKYYRNKKYGKRFKWDTATEDEKKIHALKIMQRNTKRERDCLVWVNPQNKGYGSMMWGHTAKGAHRVSWIVHKGPIPVGKWVLHTCDNPPCIEISHLFLGDARENRRDAYNKNRIPIKRGEQSNFAKLTEEKVKEIKKLLQSGADLTQTAYQFGVSYGAIADIKRNKNWKHVTVDESSE